MCLFLPQVQASRRLLHRGHEVQGEATQGQGAADASQMHLRDHRKQGTSTGSATFVIASQRLLFLFIRPSNISFFTHLFGRYFVTVIGQALLNLKVPNSRELQLGYQQISDGLEFQFI